MSSKSKEDQEFFWGVGHSAFQVEGSLKDSDWREWTQIPDKIVDKTNAEKATDFWNRYEEDFSLAKELGSNAFRMSIAWERVEPEKGRWDEEAIEHYRKIIISCRKHGLEPIVTLHHFALPLWLSQQGGLCSDTFPEEFADYSEKIVTKLGLEFPEVKWWMTFNEPLVLVNMGYLTAEWPPGLKDSVLAMKAARNLVRAHFQAVERIRMLSVTRFKISIAQHWRDFEPKNKLNPLDQAAAFYLNEIFNKNFVRALLTGNNIWWMPGSKAFVEKLPLPHNKATLDYLGINYYGRMVVNAIAKDPYIALHEGDGEKSDLGWEIYPQGLTKVLKDAAQYKLPILISENGLADHRDNHRARFVEDHIAALKKAKNLDIDLLGYLHWSLTDNFEWAFGLEPRFGLVAMDYQTGARSKRDSFEVYKRIIANERETFNS